jgi:hypothetical protein
MVEKDHIGLLPLPKGYHQPMLDQKVIVAD